MMNPHAFYRKLKGLNQAQLREVSAATLVATCGTTTGDANALLRWSYNPSLRGDNQLPEWIYHNLPILQKNSRDVLMNAKNFMSHHPSGPQTDIKLPFMLGELPKLSQEQLRELIARVMKASSNDDWNYNPVNPPELPSWVAMGMWQLSKNFAVTMRDSIVLLEYADTGEPLLHPLAGIEPSQRAKLGLDW